MIYTEAIEVLKDYEMGKITHNNDGSCPDEIYDHSKRDDGCKVCQALKFFDYCDYMKEESPRMKNVEENSFNRFDFENAISSLWNSVDDLNHVGEEVCNSGDTDVIMNLLSGIQALLNAKVRNVFEQFERGVRSGKIV